MLLETYGVRGPTTDRVEYDGFSKVQWSVHVLGRIQGPDGGGRQNEFADHHTGGCVIPRVDQRRSDVVAGGHHAR